VLVIEKVFDARRDVTIGGDASAGLLVTPWTGPTLLLISGDDLLLHLQPGMRLIMCNDDGSERLDGEFGLGTVADTEVVTTPCREAVSVSRVPMTAEIGTANRSVEPPEIQSLAKPPGKPISARVG
jgi:hypothetical protein